MEEEEEVVDEGEEEDEEVEQRPVAVSLPGRWRGKMIESSSGSEDDDDDKDDDDDEGEEEENRLCVDEDADGPLGVISIRVSESELE